LKRSSALILTERQRFETGSMNVVVKFNRRKKQ